MMKLVGLLLLSSQFAWAGIPNARIVTTGGTKERVERVYVAPTCNSNPCTIASQSGSWVSNVSWAANGRHTISIVAGTFSATPTCVGSYFGASAGTSGEILLDTVSTSSINVRLFNSSGNGADGGFSLICMGPR